MNVMISGPSSLASGLVQCLQEKERHAASSAETIFAVIIYFFSKHHFINIEVCTQTQDQGHLYRNYGQYTTSATALLYPSCALGGGLYCGFL
jgi:hypothetical protein